MPRVAASQIAIHGLMRYEPALRLIRELPGGGELLEVGSASSGVRGYGLTEPDWRVTVLDQSFDNYGQASGEGPEASSLVVGDARALPFEDRSFDVTIALDLMEHIEPPDRASVLAELVRVTRRRLIVGCPAGADALDADRRLAAGFARRGRTAPPWLAEHLQNGLPEPAELESALQRAGRVRLLGNENARAHERLMRMHFALGWLWPFRAAVSALRFGCARGSRAAGRLLWLARGRDRPPVYRTIAVVDVEPG
jgi:hypothetical protein